jgi:AraC-like DNA-binding protein
MKPMYLQREPGAALRPWVRSLWYAQGMDLAQGRERILPTGRAQVIVNLARDFIVDCQEGQPVRRMAPALLVGQRSAYEIVDTSDLADLIGVSFQPGALPVFLTDAADRVTNGYTALDDLGCGTDALRDRLHEVRGAEARLEGLEEFLRERIAARLERGRGALHPAVQFALEELRRRPAVGRVTELARRTGWSERRFSQIFREEVGFAPKVWCRIQRFQGVVQELRRGAAVRWPEVALACGFYDQAHLANEFRAFAGISPTAYVATRSRIWTNHVQVE